MLIFNFKSSIDQKGKTTMNHFEQVFEEMPENTISDEELENFVIRFDVMTIVTTKVGCGGCY
jgi:hypothetical protein